MEKLIQDDPEFKILKEVLNKGGITYKQLERYDPPKGSVDKKGFLIKPIAIYEVYGSSYHPERLSGYEVIKIKTMKGGMIAGNPIPPGEKYPSDEDIGKWGLSFHGEDFERRALEYFNQLKKEIDESCSSI